MSGFPAWDIGTVNGIEEVYDVHWLDWDTAQLSLDGEEVVTFSSAQATGFTSADGVLDEASEVVIELEDPATWGDDDEW